MKFVKLSDGNYANLEYATDVIIYMANNKYQIIISFVSNGDAVWEEEFETYNDALNRLQFLMKDFI